MARPERSSRRREAVLDSLSHDVPVSERGIVREWNAEEGWGVIDCPSAPGGCWTHFSHLDMEGYRVLDAGQEVDLTFDDRGQDGFLFRAISVVVPGVAPAVTSRFEGPSDAYRSRLTLHFDQ